MGSRVYLIRAEHKTCLLGGDACRHPLISCQSRAGLAARSGGVVSTRCITGRPRTRGAEGNGRVKADRGYDGPE